MKNKSYCCSINKLNEYFVVVPFLRTLKLILFIAITHTFVFCLIPNATACSQDTEGEIVIISEGGEKRKRNLSEESMPSKKKQKSLLDCWSTSSEKTMDKVKPIVAQESIPMAVDQVNMGAALSENCLSMSPMHLSQEIKSISFPDYNREGLYDLKVSLLTVDSWEDALNEKTKRYLGFRRTSSESSVIVSEDTEGSSTDDEKKGAKKEIKKFDVTFKEGDTQYQGLVLWETVRLPTKNWVDPLKKFLTVQDALKEEGGGEEVLPKVDHSALLFIEMSGRNFVGIIGQGRHLLKPNVRDPQFAFHAAVNGCDPKAKEAIKSIGITIPGSNPRHSYTFYDRGTSAQDVQIMSRVRSLKKIDVNKRNSDDSMFRIKASGPSLSLQRWVSIDDFPKLCQAFLTLSQSDKYKDILPWIDSLVSIDDPALLKKLEQKLLKRIADSDSFEWGLASPDDEHCSEDPTVSYKMLKESYQTIEDIVSFIRGRNYSKRELKGLKIQSLDGEGNKLNTWSVYRGILMEVNYEADICTFNQGKWYKIKQSDYDQIKKDVDRFFVNESGDSTLNFLTSLEINGKELFKAKPKDDTSKPSPKKPTRKQTKKESSKLKYGINEGAYSRRICKQNHEECLLMDARNVGINIGPERGKDVVELCDILTMSKYLITIKNWTGSGTFSHLLNQGVVPSQTLEDPKFRMSAKDQYVKAQLKEWLEHKIHDMKAEKIMDDLTGICNECAFVLPDRDRVMRDRLIKYINIDFKGHVGQADIAEIEKMIESDQKKFETILPTNIDSFNSKEYTFVYGFFHEKEYKSLSQYLPYFSLVALHNALVKLAPKYNVLIKRIPIPSLH